MVLVISEPINPMQPTASCAGVRFAVADLYRSSASSLNPSEILSARRFPYSLTFHHAPSFVTYLAQ